MWEPNWSNWTIWEEVKWSRWHKYRGVDIVVAKLRDLKFEEVKSTYDSKIYWIWVKKESFWCFPLRYGEERNFLEDGNLNWINWSFNRKVEWTKSFDLGIFSTVDPYLKEFILVKSNVVLNRRAFKKD